MRELLRTTEPVLVSFVESLLTEAGIDYHVADANTSAVEGSIGIFPRRVMVVADSWGAARELLMQVGLGDELTSRSATPQPRVAASGARPAKP